MKALLLFMALLSFTTLQCICVPKSLKVGDKAPDFELINQNGETVKLSDFKGKKVALYFYPKDSTPGCTQEACSLRDGFESLADANITILGLSKGSLKSKQRFRRKQNLNFPLLIATQEVLDDYGVSTGLLQFYLPKRWTFLIDEDGIIVAIIKTVDTKNHAQQIIDEFSSLR